MGGDGYVGGLCNCGTFAVASAAPRPDLAEWPYGSGIGDRRRNSRPRRFDRRGDGDCLKGRALLACAAGGSEGDI